MNPLENPSSNKSWYEKWHDNPISGAVHWLVVILFSVGASAIIGQAAIRANLQKANTLASADTTIQTDDLHQLTTQLLKAYKEYQKASDANKDSALNALISVASQREDAMVKKSKVKPKDVLLSALPADFVAQLPPELTALVEQDATVEGTATVMHVDYPKDQPVIDESVTVKEDSTGKKYHLDFDTDTPGIQTGDKVKAHGLAVGQELVMSLGGKSQGTSDLQITQTQALTSGVQKTLAILVNFTDNTSQPFSASDIANVIFNNPDSVNAYYEENSYGAISFSGTAVGWYTIPYPSSTCQTGYTTIASAAQSAAQAAGVNLSGYTHFVYVFPSSNCDDGSGNWAGLSTVGGNPSNSWINGYTQSFVFSHELGHGLGMYHASSLSCGSAQIGTNCTLSEYGDPYDDMGGAWTNHDLSAGHKYELGWGITQTVTSSGTYVIHPQETSSTGTQILKISKPDTGEAYYVDYRASTGFDNGIPSSMQNVSVNVWGGAQTKRLDMTPDGDFNNSALSDGGVFTDPANGITITQVSHDATSATVQVTMSGPACTSNPPQVSLSPLSQTGASGKTLAYTLTVKDMDTSSCSGTTFNLASSLPSGFTNTFSASSLSLTPGGSGTTQVSVTPVVGTPDGSYGFSASASDNGNASHAGFANATYVVFTPVPDTVPPTVTITSPAANSTVSGNKVNVTANATDNIQVAKIEVSLDGKIVKTCTSTSAKLSCTYSWNTKQSSSGTHTILARAYDAANNTNQTSITVKK